MKGTWGILSMKPFKEILRSRVDLLDEDDYRIGMGVCLDCREKMTGFMVHDHVWALSGLAKVGGSLCLECFEARIGRAVTSEDLRDCLLSVWLLIRLLKRSWALEAGGDVK
jgi:hypothetical protein